MNNNNNLKMNAKSRSAESGNDVRFNFLRRK